MTVINYIANGVFIFIILFAIFLIVGYMKYREPPYDGFSEQSERQKRNDDYNNDSHPPNLKQKRNENCIQEWKRNKN